MRGESSRPAWGEAEWEMEIRRDEGRINRYFHNLPDCIDLPDEEDCIFADISSIPELIPGNTTSDEWKKLRRFEEDSDSEDDEELDMSMYDDEIVFAVDRLGVQWSMLCVSKLAPELWQKSAGVVCGFAKLISSIENFNAADRSVELDLKKILGKRMLRDLDKLVDQLHAAGAMQSGILHDTNMLASSLLRLRELLVIRTKEL